MVEDFTIFSQIETTEYIDKVFDLKSRFGIPNLTKFEDLVNKVITHSQDNLQNAADFKPYSISHVDQCPLCQTGDQVGNHRNFVRDQRVAAGESDQAVHQDRPALLQADQKLQLDVFNRFRPGGRFGHKVSKVFCRIDFNQSIGLS